MPAPPRSGVYWLISRDNLAAWILPAHNSCSHKSASDSSRRWPASVRAGASGPSGATGSSGAAAATPPGGGRVGLLLISKYVKPGSTDVVSEYNHFSLLASIEDLFGLSRLGYAGSPGLLAFDSSVYNAG